jgi:hypothetical protein
MAEQTIILTEYYTGDKTPQMWEAVDNGFEVRKVRKLNKPYSDRSSAVTISINESLITPATVKIGSLRTQALATVTGGNSATRHSNVMGEFDRLLQASEKDSD